MNEKAETQQRCLQKMDEYIREHFQEKITVLDLALAGNISKRECFRLFQKQMSMPPMMYVNQYRMEKARMLLQKSGQPITQIALECGFGSSSYFSKVFKAIYHLTPSEYREACRFEKEP